jgi:3-hydroxyacyl-CoA dehydrogenase / 3-hydroxy-2-methylbutyryl-CoA dehydrogenase
MKIQGKTALITGGASGLGKATAQILHLLGANIMVVDMNAEKGQQICDELKERIAFIQTNVTLPDQVQAAVNKTMEVYKHIDILVNCAGTGSAMKTAGPKGPHDLNVFKMIVDLNLIATFDFIRLCAFNMMNNEPNEDGERGVIINTASIAAFEGQIGQVAYTASKAGVVGMTLTVARDLGRSGIRCNTIAPGVFNTPLMEGAPPEFLAPIVANTVFPKRLGEAPEYAGLCRHIIENAYLNGQTIRLDAATIFPPK